MFVGRDRNLDALPPSCTRAFQHLLVSVNRTLPRYGTPCEWVPHSTGDSSQRPAALL